ncbi:TonB family protein [Phycisphaeraceae bacterium D3-23]
MRPPARPRHLKLAFMCYGLSVVAHTALAWACTLHDVPRAVEGDRRSPVVMQISSGSSVTMPFFQPPPGLSETGNPELIEDDELPGGALPEEPTPEDDTPPTPPDAQAEEQAPTHAEAPAPELAEQDAEPDTAPPPSQAEGPDQPAVTPNAQAQADPVEPAPSPEPEAHEAVPPEPSEAQPFASTDHDDAPDAAAWIPRQSPASANPSANHTAEQRTANTDPQDAGQPNAPQTDTPATEPAQAETDDHAETDATHDADDAPPVERAAQQPADPPTPETDASPDTPAPREAEREATPSTTAAVYDETTVDEPIAFNEQVQPTAPAISRRQGETGVVIVRIEVDATGELVDFDVLDDAGHTRLRDAALRALRRSTFHPAARKGQPVASTRIIEYRF